MNKTSLAQLVLLATVLVLSAAFVPLAYSVARPTITAQWTTQPPTIDGTVTQGEWSNLQIAFESPTYPSSYVLPTYVYFLNDQNNLYVLVDAVGDTQDSSSDQCLLVFGFDLNPANLIKIRVQGLDGTHQSAPPFEAAIGFGGSPQDSAPHKIYEFSIPFGYINGEPGQPLTFSSPPWKSVSMPFDSDTGRDNVWPLGWTQTDINTYGLLGTAEGPLAVGGEMIPINWFQVLVPWLALIASLNILLVGTFMGRRRTSND